MSGMLRATIIAHTHSLPVSRLPRYGAGAVRKNGNRGGCV
jgi:hypothetical protein